LVPALRGHHFLLVVQLVPEVLVVRVLPAVHLLRAVLALPVYPGLLALPEIRVLPVPKAGWVQAVPVLPLVLGCRGFHWAQLVPRVPEVRVVPCCQVLPVVRAYRHFLGVRWVPVVLVDPVGRARMVGSVCVRRLSAVVPGFQVCRVFLGLPVVHLYPDVHLDQRFQGYSILRIPAEPDAWRWSC